MQVSSGPLQTDRLVASARLLTDVEKILAAPAADIRRSSRVQAHRLTGFCSPARLRPRLGTVAQDLCDWSGHPIGSKLAFPGGTLELDAALTGELADRGLLPRACTPLAGQSQGVDRALDAFLVRADSGVSGPAEFKQQVSHSAACRFCTRRWTSTALGRANLRGLSAPYLSTHPPPGRRRTSPARGHTGPRVRCPGLHANARMRTGGRKACEWG